MICFGKTFLIEEKINWIKRVLLNEHEIPLSTII